MKASFIAALMEEKGLTFKVAQMPYTDTCQSTSMQHLQSKKDSSSPRERREHRRAKRRGVRSVTPVHHIDDLAAARKQKALQDAQKVAGVIVPLRESGKSIRSICEVLNTSGIRTSRGAPFNERLVGRMLKRLGKEVC